MVESFLGDYGVENTVAVLEERLKAAPVCLRDNNVKTDKESLLAELGKLDIAAISGEPKNSLLLEKGTDIGANALFKKGLFHVEDLASQTALSVLELKKGERVLDMCAAPGGKSFTMAEMLENSGEVVSADLYEQRVELIKNGAKRLGLVSIKPIVADATVYDSSLGEFDAILCDVPCSGLGVIRRKPDIKYKPQTDYKELQDIQYKILTNAVKYLKKGGRILYSTCTLRREENENLVNRFIKEYNTFYKAEEKTLMPHINNTDGFYYALLKTED